MLGQRNTHGVKSSCACYGSFPAGSTVLTHCCRPGRRRKRTHTKLTRTSRQTATPPRAGEHELSPPRPTQCPHLHPRPNTHLPPTPHCSFYRDGSHQAGASLDKQNHFCLLRTPGTAHGVASTSCVCVCVCLSTQFCWPSDRHSVMLVKSWGLRLKCNQIYWSRKVWFFFVG